MDGTSEPFDPYKITEILKWPVVLLILVAMFRHEIRAFLSRARSLGFGGTKLEAEAATQTAAQRQLRSEAAEQAMRNFADPLLIEEEKRLTAEIAKLEPLQGPAREELVLRFLTAAWIQLDFERVYRLIWGSQLAALQHANQAGTRGIERDRMRAFYEEGKKAFPDYFGDYEFDGWLGFLEEVRVVERADSQIRITQKGRSLLSYLITQGCSLLKIG